MLAKGLLCVFEKPIMFQQFYLEIFLSTLFGHKTDRLAFGTFPILSDILEIP